MNLRAKVIEIYEQMEKELSTKVIADATPFVELNSAVNELHLLLNAIVDENISREQQGNIISLRTRMQAIYNAHSILAISAPPLRHQLNECIEVLDEWVKLFTPKSRRSSLFEDELAKVIPTEAKRKSDSEKTTTGCLPRLSKH